MIAEKTISVGDCLIPGSRMAKWIRRLSGFGSEGLKSATICAAVIVVAQTVTYKLIKLIFTVCHPAFRMRL